VPQPLWANSCYWLSAVDLVRELPEGKLSWDFANIHFEEARASKLRPNDSQAETVVRPSSLRQTGARLCDVTFESKSITVPHHAGFIDLAYLLENPGKTFTALELLTLVGGGIEDAPVSQDDLLSLSSHTISANDEILDQQAFREIQQRITGLT